MQRASPALGEHTNEVLAELGFTADELSDFRAQGVIVWRAGRPDCCRPAFLTKF